MNGSILNYFGFYICSTLVKLCFFWVLGSKRPNDCFSRGRSKYHCHFLLYALCNQIIVLSVKLTYSLLWYNIVYLYINLIHTLFLSIKNSSCMMKLFISQTIILVIIENCRNVIKVTQKFRIRTSVDLLCKLVHWSVRSEELTNHL